MTRAPRPAPAKVDESARVRRVRFRALVAASVVSLTFVAIAYKAWGLQIDSSDHFRSLAARQHLRTVEIAAPRGEIRDRSDRPMAATADADSVYANPREVVDVAGTAEALARVLDLDVRVVEARLGSPRHFAWIERQVSAEEAAAVRKLALPGIDVAAEPRRYYPGKSSGGPLLGFAGIDGDGLDGVELAMNELLTGERASFRALRDATGGTMMSQGLVEATPGATVTLTVDRAIQFIADQALAEAAITHEARSGSVVVLDVATSKVLAMASWPTYDPNAPDGGAAAGDREPRPPARNRAVTDTYEIGSVMKVFTVAAALEAGTVRPDDIVDAEGGKYKVGRKLVTDVHHDFELSIGGILKRSSNVGAVKLAQRMGRDALYATLRTFGFGEATGIELPGEQSGVLRDPKKWGEIGLATVAYGYGMTVTSMQVAAGFAAIGNGGIYREPRLIEQVTAERDGALRTLYQHTDASRRVISAKTAAELLPMLESVFDKGKKGGTAKDIVIDGFRAGGKSGTAHKVDPHTGAYSKKLYLASFAGIAPIDAPRIAVVVVLDEPTGKDYFGAKVAGPVFAQVVSETLRYLGVPASPPRPGADADAAAASGAGGTDDDEREALEPPPLPPRRDDESDDDGDAPLPDGLVRVPDFLGMGIAQAVETARARGLEVSVEGSGRAVAQEPPPGPAPVSSEVRIVFERAQAAGIPSR